MKNGVGSLANTVFPAGFSGLLEDGCFAGGGHRRKPLRENRNALDTPGNTIVRPGGVITG